MSQYNLTEEYSDRLFSQQQQAMETIEDLSFKVKAYEKLLSEATIAAVKEDLRIKQLLEAYPPLVYEAYETLREIHGNDHDDECQCVKRAIEIRNQHLIDNYDPYDDFVGID